jgi:hypothetical protein
MGTRATKGTGENKGFGQRKTLLSKTLFFKKLLSKKYPINFYAPRMTGGQDSRLDKNYFSFRIGGSQ